MSISPHLFTASYKFIQRPQLSLFMYTIHMVSTLHHYLKVVSLQQPLGAGKTSGTYIPRQGRGCGTSDCLGLAHGSAGSCVLMKTLSNTPLLTKGSYNRTHTPLPQCALSGQQRGPLACKWLIWWLSGHPAGPFHCKFWQMCVGVLSSIAQ